MIRRATMLSLATVLFLIPNLKAQGPLARRVSGELLSKPLLEPLAEYLLPFRPGPLLPFWPGDLFGDKLAPSFEWGVGLERFWRSQPDVTPFQDCWRLDELCHRARREGHELLYRLRDAAYADHQIEIVVRHALLPLHHARINGMPAWRLERETINLSPIALEVGRCDFLSLDHYDNVRFYRLRVQSGCVRPCMNVFRYCRAFLEGFNAELVYRESVPNSDGVSTITFFVAWPGVDAEIKGLAFHFLDLDSRVSSAGRSLLLADERPVWIDEEPGIKRPLGLAPSTGVDFLYRDALSLPVRYSLRTAFTRVIERAYLKAGSVPPSAGQLTSQAANGFFPVSAGEWRQVPCELSRRSSRGAGSDEYRHSRFQDLAVRLLDLQGKMPSKTALSDSLTALVLDAEQLGFQSTPDSIPAGFVIVDPPWLAYVSDPPMESHIVYCYWKTGLREDRIDVERVLNIVYVGSRQIPFEILKNGIASVIRGAIRECLTSGKKKN